MLNKDILGLIPADSLHIDSSGNFSVFSEDEIEKFVEKCLENNLTTDEIHLIINEIASAKATGLIYERFMKGALSIHVKDGEFFWKAK